MCRCKHDAEYRVFSYMNHVQLLYMYFFENQSKRMAVVLMDVESLLG